MLHDIINGQGNGFGVKADISEKMLYSHDFI